MYRDNQKRELTTDNRIYVYIRLFQNQYSAEYQYTRYTFARSRRKTKQFAPYRCQTLNGTYAYANVREFSGPLEAGGIDAAILMERTRPWKFCVHRESGRDFEKLGRLLLINEAWLIENCLKLLITMSRGSQRWQQNSFRIRSARVTIAIDTQNDFLYHVKRKHGGVRQLFKYQTGNN